MENKCTFRAIISGLPVLCKFASCVQRAPDWALHLMRAIPAVNWLALHCVPEHVTDWNRQNGWTRIKVKNIRADPSHPCRSVFYSAIRRRPVPPCAGARRMRRVQDRRGRAGGWRAERRRHPPTAPPGRATSRGRRDCAACRPLRAAEG